MLTASAAYVFGVIVLQLRPGVRRAPLRRSLYQLGAVATVLAVAEAYLAVALYPDHAVTVAAYPFVGLAFVAVGCLATLRRPANATGSLLIVNGLLVLVAAVSNIDETHLLTIGNLTSQLPIAAFLHLVLAFPAGRLTNRLDRTLVVAGYLLVTVIQLPVVLPDVAWLDLPRLASLFLGIFVLVLAAVRQAVRVVRTDPRDGRPMLLLVSGYGIAMLIFFPVSARVLAPWLGLDPFERFSFQMIFFALAPFVFGAGILRGGFGRAGELDELTGWLGSEAAGRSTLRDTLARLLGDPSLQVLFPGPDTRTFIDADGRPATPTTSPWRAQERVVAADGALTATLDYDRTVLSDPAAVQQAGRVAALALQREGLQAELLAEREALRASRTRVMEVGDQQRRTFAQDLHDVLQSRLTLAAMHAGALAADSCDERTRASAEKLRLELDGLITEFRSMVHGVMPALLVERGLVAAAEDLIDRQPVPAHLHVVGEQALPPLVSTSAYFILAEALANAVRHGEPTRVDVVIDQRGPGLVLAVRDDGIGGALPTGAGLRSIADRVEALGGVLVVDSPSGAGTRIEVVLPCGS